MTPDAKPLLALVLLLACAACKPCETGCATAAEAPVPAGRAPAVVDRLPDRPLDLHILVDQFGYRPQDDKVAVIRSPEVGFDAAEKFKPGRHYELRRVADGKAVFAGEPVAWLDGAVQASSGDRGWWFDFSAVREPGRYYVWDVEQKRRSPSFEIGAEVYRQVLKAAMRTYYYQRSGHAKQPPHAEACWADAPAYLGKDQDLQARDLADPDNPVRRRNVAGGWFDAGDTNKYVTYALQPVHQLLSAWEEHPSAFGDDFNIPESGNGIPDVIDEVKWELDWLKTMQNADGSAALKVGNIAFAKTYPPSSDASPRYYIGSCTSSTIAVASLFAHASAVYARFPALAGEAQNLRGRAIAAWKQYQRSPHPQTDCDNQVIHAGDADLSAEEQAGVAAEAAIYLFALTGDAEYDAYLHAHYKALRPYRDMGWSRYRPDEGEALLAYTRLPLAEPELRATILADKARDAQAGNQIYGFNAKDDLYRAYLHPPQYHWGSNSPRAAYGTTNLDAIRYGVDPMHDADFALRAANTLHYFHGVNPLAMVYLSNMGAYGATRSANAIFHLAYWEGTKWGNAASDACGPPPGYVPGGPNASAVANGVPASLSPPANQPAQKSYRDWNTNAQAPWAVTEPGIYYQSAYVRLLSAFVGSEAAASGPHAEGAEPAAKTGQPER